jgi:CBS domain-containing protein
MTRAPDTIGELMTTEVVTVTPETSVRDALARMIEHDIGSVVVAEGSTALGVFTERDVTRHVLTDVGFLDEPVGAIMSTRLVTRGPDAPVVNVFDLMNELGIRRLPVVDDDRLVGIVTEGDLRRWVGQVARE